MPSVTSLSSRLSLKGNLLTPEVYIFSALIGASAALLGIGAKMLFDGVSTRKLQRREDSRILLVERKAAFEKFLSANRKYLTYQKRLHDLMPAAARGEEAPPGVLDQFPKSPMPELVESLEEVRGVARTYAVIHAADSIVQLHGDLAVALGHCLAAPDDPNNEITLFLLKRFAEDREREFMYAFRDELGLGLPEGAPIGYGMPRNPQLASAESYVRRHLSFSSHRTTTDQGGDTQKDGYSPRSAAG